MQGSPASFSRLMDKVLLDVDNAVTFINNILVHSKTTQEHVHQLDSVLSSLQQAGIKLNLPKCARMCHTWVTWGDGIRPGQDKWQALRAPRAPKDIHIKSFQGLSNFFPKFVAGYTQKAAPLHPLT